MSSDRFRPLNEILADPFPSSPDRLLVLLSIEESDLAPGFNVEAEDDMVDHHVGDLRTEGAE